MITLGWSRDITDETEVISSYDPYNSPYLLSTFKIYIEYENEVLENLNPSWHTYQCTVLGLWPE